MQLNLPFLALCLLGTVIPCGGQFNTTTIAPSNTTSAINATTPDPSSPGPSSPGPSSTGPSNTTGPSTENATVTGTPAIPTGGSVVGGSPEGLSSGAIAGIAIGSIAGVAALGAGEQIAAEPRDPRSTMEAYGGGQTKHTLEAELKHSIHTDKRPRTRTQRERERREREEEERRKTKVHSQTTGMEREEGRERVREALLQRTSHLQRQQSGVYNHNVPCLDATKYQTDAVRNFPCQISPSGVG
ncbi:hypothetical protein EYF80_042445 [Liparis tanakae]|uniref:Uncharacterized protein n=1 Tax=Liparis tanakae TaxID=230148 RepID=A0A4Z2G1I3_9TELE|nr:hypothetical protein EYF80_042445 [Liparis tanakae]